MKFTIKIGGIFYVKFFLKVLSKHFPNFCTLLNNRLLNSSFEKLLMTVLKVGSHTMCVTRLNANMAIMCINTVNKERPCV